MRRRLGFAGILALVIAATSGSASADLFRCQTPNGNVVFTDREDACATRAEEHELTGVVQKYEPIPVALTSAPSVRKRSSLGAQRKGQSHFWREKKIHAHYAMRDFFKVKRSN